MENQSPKLSDRIDINVKVAIAKPKKTKRKPLRNLERDYILFRYECIIGNL